MNKTYGLLKSWMEEKSQVEDLAKPEQTGGFNPGLSKGVSNESYTQNS